MRWKKSVFQNRKSMLELCRIAQLPAFICRFKAKNDACTQL